MKDTTRLLRGEKIPSEPRKGLHYIVMDQSGVCHKENHHNVKHKGIIGPFSLHGIRNKERLQELPAAFQVS